MTHTERTEFLGVEFDRPAFRAVIRRLARVSAVSPYGYVVTPNVDHLVRFHSSRSLGAIYRQAALCLCDSRILSRLARLAGVRLPVVAGSDLTRALFADVIAPGDRIAVVGGTAQLVANLGAKRPGVTILHHDAPMGLGEDAVARRAAASFVAGAGARFTFLAVGSPQQEMIANEVLGFPYATGVALCIGASLEFLTGDQKRAPRLVQLSGLEWAHRLASNPSRFWRRYLVDGMKIFPIFARSHHSKRLRSGLIRGGALLAAAIIALLAFRPGSALIQQIEASGSPTARPLPTGSAAAAQVNLPPPDLLRPLSVEQAAEQNAERPFVARPDDPAAHFVLKPGASGRLNALTCLTQAVYYEAASEGVDGGRAVAQVVLNRMRHPAYPASVCGVVYQGSERQTGCQFSFTCDGSLQRIPNPAIWGHSRKIAESALAGHVFAPVGHATYYHADYVVPYWADSLDKTIQIGQHIFYRLRGSLGDRREFHQVYNGLEVVPTATPATLPEVLLPGPVAQLPPNLIADDLVQDLPVSKLVAPEAAPRPIADAAQGTLIADAGAPAPMVKRRKPVSECATAGADEKRLMPLGANHTRATGQSIGC